MRRDERECAGSRGLVLWTVHKNASGLLGLARRHSLCSTARMPTTVLRLEVDPGDQPSDSMMSGTASSTVSITLVSYSTHCV